MGHDRLGPGPGTRLCSGMNHINTNMEVQQRPTTPIHATLTKTNSINGPYPASDRCSQPVKGLGLTSRAPVADSNAATGTAP